jgi:hypothetical protein
MRRTDARGQLWSLLANAVNARFKSFELHLVNFDQFNSAAVWPWCCKPHSVAPAPTFVIWATAVSAASLVVPSTILIPTARGGQGELGSELRDLGQHVSQRHELLAAATPKP